MRVRVSYAPLCTYEPCSLLAPNAAVRMWWLTQPATAVALKANIACLSCVCAAGVSTGCGTTPVASVGWCTRSHCSRAIPFLVTGHSNLQLATLLVLPSPKSQVCSAVMLKLRSALPLICLLLQASAFTAHTEIASAATVAVRCTQRDVSACCCLAVVCCLAAGISVSGTYAGCFRDSSCSSDTRLKSPLVQNEPKMTVKRCLEMARLAGWPYAGVAPGTVAGTTSCFGGDKVPTEAVSNGCLTACSGNFTERCGDSNCQVSVYSGGSIIVSVSY